MAAQVGGVAQVGVQVSWAGALTGMPSLVRCLFILITTGSSGPGVLSSGVATGPNLHYEVRVNDQPVDPLGQGQRIMLGEQSTQSEYQASLYEARDRLEQAIGTASIYDLISLNEQ